ncbi:MAG TPA: hypothetical protein VGS97_13170 [Actinocrinis sp.]|uniref:hypothetical protein n=1 Tax=Actinocrinis sp. TaxID=1920516 RepID=UPI002DDDB646|nr:hypothetical protein [Actinocrinis sp.]HEV2345041.1 hypothetical protein [Actinocrinis sp.]
MPSILKRSIALAVVSLCAAAGVLASAATASASTGNWGWPERSTTVAHGTTAFTTFGMECLTNADCTAETGTTLTFSPQAGTGIVDPNHAIFPFVRSDTGAVVGTCAANLFGLQCTLNVSVTLAYQDELIGVATGSGVALAVPAYLPPGTVVGEWTWYDPNGMTGFYPPTETIVAVVNGF